jgi:hypothetical protein
MLVATLALDWLIVLGLIFPLLPENAPGGAMGLGFFFFSTLLIIVGFTEQLKNKGD